MMLKVGELAPDFSLPDQAGNLVSLADVTAQGELILYFYPADFSPVCTAQACAMRDNYAGIEALGIQVVGVSPQSEWSHEKFIARHTLPFPLLSDTDKRVIKAYGVDGPMGFGVRRATFLIDGSGQVKNRVVADFTTADHIAMLQQTMASAASS